MRLPASHWHPLAVKRGGTLSQQRSQSRRRRNGRLQRQTLSLHQVRDFYAASLQWEPGCGRMVCPARGSCGVTPSLYHRRFWIGDPTLRPPGTPSCPQARLSLQHGLTQRSLCLDRLPGGARTALPTLSTDRRQGPSSTGRPLGREALPCSSPGAPGADPQDRRHTISVNDVRPALALPETL